MRVHWRISVGASQVHRREADAQPTCMVSRSCTYLRSVSTISRIILFLATSFASVGWGRLSVERLSREMEVAIEVSGTWGSKALGGRWFTMAVTVLMT